MKRTLLVLGTHFIDENVISEFRKMKNTPNVDAVLMIDNTNPKIEFKNRVENKTFFGTNCKCFFVDQELNDELQLPYFEEGGKKDFAKNSLHNGDFRFYYLRKFFKDYVYYWLIEYDVFCNAENYAGFLKKFDQNHADLLIQDLLGGNKIKTSYIERIEWVYNDLEKVFQGLFAVVRLSARAIDFLNKRRLDHIKIFHSSNMEDKRWIFCEIFVPTELVNAGFICEDLGEKRVKFLPQIYLNDERIFIKPDNHLYHPVKSVKSEISKIEKQYADLFYSFRKIFLTNLAEKLNQIPIVKDLQIQFAEDFSSVVIDLLNRRGGQATCGLKLGF